MTRPNRVCAAIVASLTFGATTAAQDPPAAVALAWDERGQVLHTIVPGTGSRQGQAANIRAESVVVSHDRSRLVTIWQEPRTQIVHATILERASLRTLGDVAMGVVCLEWFQTADGRYLAVTCWEPRKSRKDPDQKQLLGIDLSSGTLAGRLPIPGESKLFDGGNGRVLVVARRFSPDSDNAIIASSLPSLQNPARLNLPCAGTVHPELLTSDRRRLFVRCDAERVLPKDARAFPSSISIVDLETMSPPRVVPLGEDVFGDWSMADERFIYVNSSPGERQPTLEPAVVVFSVEKEGVTERVPLSRDADRIQASVRGPWTAWASGNAFLVRSSSTLLLFRDGRVVSRTDLPGKMAYGRLTESPDRRRLYVTGERTLVALDAAAGARVWANTLTRSGSLSVSPDGQRALMRDGDDMTLLDLSSGATLAEFKASTRGGRAGLFWKDLGLSFLSGALGGGYVNSATAAGIAFSATTRRAMILASTGEVTLVDLADGRTITRLSDRAAALVALPETPLAMVVSAKQVVIFDMTAGQNVQKLSFPDAPDSMPPHLTLSKDGTTLAVGAGSTVYFVSRISGRLVSRADGLGRIGHLMFVE